MEINQTLSTFIHPRNIEHHLCMQVSTAVCSNWNLACLGYWSVMVGPITKVKKNKLVKHHERCPHQCMHTIITHDLFHDLTSNQTKPNLAILFSMTHELWPVCHDSWHRLISARFNSQIQFGQIQLCQIHHYQIQPYLSLTLQISTRFKPNFFFWSIQYFIDISLHR